MQALVEVEDDGTCQNQADIDKARRQEFLLECNSARAVIEECREKLILNEDIIRYLNKILKQQISCQQDLECLQLVGACLKNISIIVKGMQYESRRRTERNIEANLSQLKERAGNQATGHPVYGVELAGGTGLFVLGASAAGSSFILMFVLTSAMIASNPVLLVAAVILVLTLATVISSAIALLGVRMAIDSMKYSGFSKNLLFFADEVEHRFNKGQLKLDEDKNKQEDLSEEESVEENSSSSENS